VTFLFALTAAVVFGTGAYLVLDRDLVRVVLGLVLISQAAVLTLIASSLRRGVAPIYPLGRGEVSDPLSQAMALTAIVIGLAVTALILALVVRVVHVFGSEQLDELAAEAQRQARTESAEDEAHEVEEGAAR
jgi:multicomponent Na+:H+ antiporter subunit C